jgi:ADP-ribose pyrophosphatase YjhB (NUDIX family)
VAGIVINDEGKALAIQRRDNGHWEPPGGVLELGETVDDGVIREVLEETGVKVEVGELTGVYKNVARGIVALVFRCTMIGGEAEPTEESIAVEWLTQDQIRELVQPTYACRFLDAMTGDHPTVIRAHDGRQLIQPE